MRLVVKEVGDAKATLDGGDVLFTGDWMFSITLKLLIESNIFHSFVSRTYSYINLCTHHLYGQHTSHM